MKRKSIIPDLLSYKAFFFTFLLMMGTGVPPAFSQSLLPYNKRAHLVQWIPIRVIPESFHQLKLFYEYQPAASKISFGVAPSVSKGKTYSTTVIFGTTPEEIIQKAVELQPFINIVKRLPRSEFYAQFFLKAGYFDQYYAEFATEKYYHQPYTILGIYSEGGTYADNTYKPESFYSFGGGCLLGYRKLFGSHWFMDINAGLQYLAHSQLQYPEEPSWSGRTYIKFSNFNSFGDPGSFFTSHLGFGYRFIKK